MICISCSKEHPFLNDYQHLQIVLPALVPEEPSKNEEGEANSSLEEPLCLRKKTKSSPAWQWPSEYATFWQRGWLKSLCSCEECELMYQTEKVAFLLEERDGDLESSIETTTAQGVNLMQNGLDVLRTLVPNQAHQLDILHEFDSMRSQLNDYLGSLHQSNTVVTKAVSRKRISRPHWEREYLELTFHSTLTSSSNS